MDAAAEREMRVAAAVEPERVGVLEHVGVAVGGAVEQHDAVAGLERAPVERGGAATVRARPGTGA